MDGYVPGAKKSYPPNWSGRSGVVVDAVPLNQSLSKTLLPPDHFTAANNGNNTNPYLLDVDISTSQFTKAVNFDELRSGGQSNAADTSMQGDDYLIEPKWGHSINLN